MAARAARSVALDGSERFDPRTSEMGGLGDTPYPGISSGLTSALDAYFP